MKELNLTLKEIANIIKGEVVGNPNIKIKGISGIKEAKEGDITFVANPKYLPLIYQTKASAIIVSKDIKEAPKPLIRCDNPSLAFAKVVNLIAPPIKRPKGISELSFIDKSAQIAENVSIGPFTIIEAGAKIGKGTIIYGNCYIGHDTEIGQDCLIYSNVSIRERIKIGNRVIIHSGAVIGSDGFGFATVRGVQHKIPQIGTVVIEDDVEIGANVTIDRARFDKTVIGKGTKIDNLVQIAHNVIIGENCIIVAQSGISGSTILEDNVIVAGQAGIVGHIKIGKNSIIMAKSGVSKSVPPDTKVFGYPAKEASHAKRVNACVQKLPELFKEMRDLKAKIKNLEEKIKEFENAQAENIKR